MIVLDYIKELKKAVEHPVSSFFELLKEAEKKEFENKKTILEHFASINIKEKENLIHLKYNTKKMFKQPWDSFYEKVRALVIDWIEEEIIIYPFDKFFELDEHKSSTLKKVKEYLKTNEEVEITEKIDGSLIPLRYYKGEVLIVSSGTFDSPHVEIAKELLNKDTELFNFVRKHKDYTIIVEMKNKLYPQLIQYGEDKLTIIGMRNMNTFHLLNRKEICEIAKKYIINIVPKLDLSVEKMLEIMENPNESNNEGYVLRIGNFMVKMKTKNFILANRFAGEPVRNFNMVIEAINEGREKAIRPMIKPDYLESYDISIEMVRKYVREKEQILFSMYKQIDENLDMKDFVKEAQQKFFPYTKELTAIKLGRYSKLSKEDINYLKKFANKLTCVSHFKYAELNQLPLEDVVVKLEDGEIKYLKKFEDSYSKQTIYIIHKWQWINLEEIKFEK